MRWLKLLLILPLTTLWLAGCNPDGSDPVVVATVVCPVLRNYDQATQDRALAEYKALPKDSAIKQMIGDYSNLREQVRACRKAK